MKNCTLFGILSLLFLFSACNNSQALQDQLTSTQTELEDAKKMLQAIQNDPKEEPGFIHNVYFWLNEGVSEEDIKEFEKGVRGLAKISSVKSLILGPPAMTPREVVDNTYAYALIVHFADKAGHDLYQDDPIHLEMIERSKHVWSRVQIYDNLVE